MAFSLPRDSQRTSQLPATLPAPGDASPGSCRGHPLDSRCYVEGWRIRPRGTTQDWIDLRCRSFRCTRDRDRIVGRVARRSAGAITRFSEPCLVTLTLRHVGQWPCPPCGSSKELQAAWNRLRGMIVRKYGPTVYLRVREWTSAGVGHYHVIMDRRVDHTWLIYAWHRATKWSSWIVDSQAIIPGPHGFSGVADYIAAYLSRGLSQQKGREEGPRSWKLAAHPKGLRRYGTSRGWALWEPLVRGRFEVSTPSMRRSRANGLTARRPDRWVQLDRERIPFYCPRCRGRACTCAGVGGRRRRRPTS